jgi:hypothetical protein
MLNLIINILTCGTEIQKTYRQEKIDLCNETAAWKTSEADATFEVEALTDAIDNRDKIRMMYRATLFTVK